MSRRLPVFALTLASFAPASLAQVVIVDGPASGTYPTIQSAIDAALDGDVVLIGPGNYGAFSIAGKGLALFAAPGANVTVGVPSIVRNVPAGRSVVLSGLTSGSGALGSDALQLSNDAGHVRVQDCSWHAIDFPLSTTTSSGYDGGDAIEIVGCAHVAISDCTLTGGRGRKITVSLGIGGAGGAGLNVSNSTVAVCAVETSGGIGGQGNWGGNGGHGLYGYGSTVFASGSSFTGGNGGDARGGFVAGPGGLGGSGLFAWSFMNVRVLDNEYQRGHAGVGFNAGGITGPGKGLYAPGAVVYSDVARTLSSSTIASDGTSSALTVTGLALDATYLRVQRRPQWAYGSLAIGPWLVPAAPLADIPPLAIVPATDVLNASYAPREVGPLRRARVDYLQVVAIDAFGGKFLSSPRHVLVFDDAAGPDCNGNSVPDVFDIACGLSVDANHDGRPDECP